MTDGYLYDLLADIKNISASGSTSSTHLDKAISTLDDFVARIGSADESLTDELVKELKQALGNVSYTLTCYDNKAKTVNIIKEDCKKGSDDLRDIYDKVVAQQNTNSGRCTDDVSKNKLKIKIAIYA